MRYIFALLLIAFSTTQVLAEEATKPAGKIAVPKHKQKGWNNSAWIDPAYEAEQPIVRRNFRR